MAKRVVVKYASRMALMPACLLGLALLMGCSQTHGSRSGGFYKPEDRSPGRDTSSQTYTVAEYERMGDGAFLQGNLEFAFFNYERALRLNPKNRGLRAKRAWVLVAGNFNEEAEQEFKTVLVGNADSAAAREGLGQAYFQMKRYDLAREQFNKALALNAGRWRARNFLGIMHNQSNEPLKAIEEFQAAIAIRPASGILHNNLGMAYSLAGEYEKALAAFDTAYELGAPRQKTLNNFGLVLAKTGNIAGATDVFLEVGDKAQAHNNLGCMYLSQGDHDMAVESFEKALSLSQDDGGIAQENLRRFRRSTW